MTANLRDRYYEELWESVPHGARPPGLERRLEFLLEHLSRFHPSPGAPSAGADVPRALGEAPPEQLRVLDVAEEPLRRARSRHPGLDLRRVEADGCWPLADASFDAVWAGETIEHVLDTAGWLSELRRVLRSGGQLLLSTPAHGPLTRLALAVSARRFDRRFDPRGDHLRFYTRGSLACSPTSASSRSACAKPAACPARGARCSRAPCARASRTGSPLGPARDG